MKTRGSLAMVLTLVLLAGSGIGAAAQDEAPVLDPMATAFVTGIVGNVGAPSTRGTTDVLDNGVTERRGWVFSDIAVESSDPRLQGTMTVAVNSDERRTIDDAAGGFGSLEVTTSARRLVNDDGSWVGSAVQLFRDGVVDTESITLRGEGAYEGLGAYLVLDFLTDTFQGAIFLGELPPIPDMPQVE